MKYRKILLILAIATLSLTACKKEENPAPAEATAIEETKEETEPIVENDENMETITNADRGAATGDVVEAPETENTENSISGVDSTGSDVQIDEGDYVEPSVEDNAEAADKVASNNGIVIPKNEALADAQRWLDEGLIDEAGYQELLEMIEDAYAPKPSQPSQQPSYGQIQLTPEQQAAADAMDTTGQGDQRTDIQYGQGDYSDLADYETN